MCKYAFSGRTRQVYNLFQDLWKRFIILEVGERNGKSLLCQGFADRQPYRTGGGTIFFRGSGGWGATQNFITDFENSVLRPVFHR